MRAADDPRYTLALVGSGRPHAGSEYVRYPTLAAAQAACEIAEVQRIVDTDAIRGLRERRGWSVTDLATRCGVSPRTVEGWEQGRSPSGPALVALMRLMRAR